MAVSTYQAGPPRSAAAEAREPSAHSASTQSAASLKLAHKKEALAKAETAVQTQQRYLEQVNRVRREYGKYSRVAAAAYYTTNQYYYLKQRYLEVFVEHGAPEYLMKTLRLVIFHEGRRKRSSISQPPCVDGVWAVVPFHPACKLVPIQGRVAQIIMDPSWRAANAEAMGRGPPIIKVAWANVLPTFASRLRLAAVQLNVL
jgi:hypothetical protein